MNESSDSDRGFGQWNWYSDSRDRRHEAARLAAAGIEVSASELSELREGCDAPQTAHRLPSNETPPVVAGS